MSAGTVYLLHFDQPYQHARHYVGWASNVKRRLAEHEAGRGARLLAVVRAAGIGWQLARMWPGSRARERQIKRQGGHARHCPLCGVKPRRVPVNADGSLSRSRTTDAQKLAAGVMTAAQLAEHTRAAPRRGDRQAIPARRPRPAALRPLGGPGRPRHTGRAFPRRRPAPDRSIPMNRSALCALLILGGLVPAMFTASFTAPRPVAAFIAAHLLLLAGGPAVVLAGTVGAVLWLRRFSVPQGRGRLADPAARQLSRADMTVRVVPARPRRAIEVSRGNPDGGAR